jgi:hypothetical protein
MSALEQLRACSAALEQACCTLADPTPDALDVCSAVLSSAVEDLTSLQPELCGGGALALAEAWHLRRTIRRAGALLANAANYHRQWQDWVGVRTAGYGPDGRAGDSTLPNRLCVRG